MRLINTKTLELCDSPKSPSGARYAILSHTWGHDDDELSHQDYKAGRKQNTPGHDKIMKSCDNAQKRGIPYLWVDTCCIDKTNFTELTESIQSMFDYYHGAEVCLAFLDQLVLRQNGDGTPSLKELKRCRWFSRGWTLQELLASRVVEFYDHNFKFTGYLHNLAPHLATITGIRQKYLIRSMSFRNACVAARMSWIAQRDTSRPEDIAYCLIGIFQVDMPLFYGEGRRKAFMRLQEHIISQSDDESIFAWDAIHEARESLTGSHHQHRGMLAEDPKGFRNGANLCRSDTDSSVVPLRPPYKFTNRGLTISVLTWIDPGRDLKTELVPNCERTARRRLPSNGRWVEEPYGKVVIRLRRNWSTQSHIWYRVGIQAANTSTWPNIHRLRDWACNLASTYTKICVARSSSDLETLIDSDLGPSHTGFMMHGPGISLMNHIVSLQLVFPVAWLAAGKQSDQKLAHPEIWSMVAWSSLLYGFWLCKQRLWSPGAVIIIVLPVSSLYGDVTWSEWIFVLTFLFLLYFAQAVVAIETLQWMFRWAVEFDWMEARHL